MVYFFVVLIMLSPLYLGFTNQLVKNKYPLFNYLLLPFASIQLLISPFTITKVINYHGYLIYSAIVLFIIFALYISFNIYLWIKHRANFKWKEYVQYVVIFAIMNVFLIFLIFTWYSSTKTNNDLNYYINISTNFKYSIYSSGPNVSVNGNNISSLTNYYLLPQMYYLYGSIFSDNISTSYMLLNPLIYALIVSFISNSIIDYLFKNSKLIIKSLFLITTMFASLSCLYINVTSGNLAIQSLVLLMLIVNLLTIRNKNIIIYTPFIALSFFSSTGVLTSIVPIIIISLVLLYRNGYNDLLHSIPILFISLFLNVLAFTNILSMNLIFVGYSLLILLTIGCFITNWYLNRKNINHFINAKYSTISNKKAYFITALFIFTIILTFVFNYFLYQKFGTLYFEKNYAFFYLFIMMLILAIFLLEKFKANKLSFLSLIILFVNLLSILELIISSFVIYSASSWRLIYLLVGFGNIPDTILLIFLLVCTLSYDLYSYTKVKEFKLIKTSISNNKIIYSLSIFICTMITTFSMVASYTPAFVRNPTNLSFNSNVQYNLSFATSNDIRLLKNISFNNWSKTYITDMPIYQYLNEATDLTGFINYDGNNKICSSYHWNYNDFYSGIDYWNMDNPNQKMNKTPIDLINGINKIINNIKNLNVKNKNMEVVSSLDYIILNKQTPYYHDLFNQYANTYTNIIYGDKITILGK